MLNRRQFNKLATLVTAGALLSPLDVIAQDSKPSTRQNPQRQYAVIVSSDTYEDKSWKSVVEALQTKYPETRVHVYEDRISELKEAVKSHDPTHIAFVARPEEIAIPHLACDDKRNYDNLGVMEEDLESINKSGLGQFHRFLYGMGDGYATAIGGVITGETAEDALRLAKAKPMRVKRLAAKTMAEEFVPIVSEYGLGFSDGKSPDGTGGKSLKVYESNEGKVERSRTDRAGPRFYKMLSEGRPDLVMTNGHASDRNWNSGYQYLDDFMQRDENGKPIMYDPAEKSVRGQVKGSEQTIFWSPGSCLWGRVRKPEESLMFALMRHAGDIQHFGAANVTWHGFVGGGMRDPLITTTERVTFFEALHMSRIAAEHERRQIENLRVQKEYGPQIESFGKTWDLAGFAGYGDPALDTSIEFAPTYVPELEKKITSTPKGLTLSLKALRDLSGCERPVVFNLPRGTKFKGIKAPEGLVYEAIDNRHVVVQVGREIVAREGEIKYEMRPVKKGTSWSLELSKD